MAAPKNNLYALGNTGGAPRKYDSAQELEEKCSDYFKFCLESKENPKITGLCLFLGFNSRDTLAQYISRNDELSDIIKRAKLGVECHYEEGLNTFKSVGAIFALKNMGWKDQVESHVTQTITNVTPQVVNVDTPLSRSESDIKM